MWQDAERQTAKKVGGKRVKGSGAPMQGNDVITGQPLKGFSIEVKATEHNSLTINLNLLERLRERALREGRTPALVLQIKGKRVWCFFEETLTVKDGNLIIEG